MTNREREEWQEWLEDVEASPEFAAENVKLDFALALERRMNQLKVSRAELARKLKTSAAAITNTLRGDANLSIDRMVRLTCALDADLHIHIAPKNSKVRWFEVHRGNQREQINHAQTWAKSLTGETGERYSSALAH